MEKLKNERNSDKDQKTIIYIGNFDVSCMNAAGKRVLNLSRLLVKLGYKLVLIESTKSKEILKRPINIEKNIKLYSIKYPKNYLQWCQYQKKYSFVTNIVKEESKSSNIKYMIFYGSLSIYLLVKKLLKYNKKNKIISLADVVDWLNVGIKNPLARILKIFDNYKKRRINFKMDGLIVISEYLHSYYKNKKTVIIPPLMEPHFLKLDDIDNKNNNMKKIYYAGSPFKSNKIIANKNTIKDRVDLMIELLNSTNEEFCFDIYGITKEEFLIMFPKMVDSIGKNIHFYGKIDNREFTNIICNYDFSILFRENWRESNAGFPTKIAESISMFVPVITNDTSDISKYIKNGKNGYIIDVFNQDKAILQLKKILAIDKSKIIEMKEYCRDNQVFDLNNYCDVLNSFLCSFDD